MKKIIIASALVCGILLACQKPSELDNLEKSTVNSSRSSKDGLNDNTGAKEQNFYYNATLIAVRGEKNSDDIAKYFENFPDANAIYRNNNEKKVSISFLTVSYSTIANSSPSVFSLNSVQSEPVTILNGVLSQFKVCSTPTNPQIQCISPSEMQDKVSRAFGNAGYNLLGVNVSTNGDIEVVINNQTAPSGLGACIATIISYFN